jgi:hypothetical protein
MGSVRFCSGACWTPAPPTPAQSGLKADLLVLQNSRISALQFPAENSELLSDRAGHEKGRPEAALSLHFASEALPGGE